MTGQVGHDVLRRMATPPPPAPEDVPLTSSRAVRLAITRAADKTHNMVVSVSALREEVMPLDDMLAAFDPELMFISMMMGGRVMGLAALDLNMRAALLETQTIGKVLDTAPEPRPPTGTDARMVQPLIAAFLSHLLETSVRTPLDTWGQGYTPGDRIGSARAAGLVLDDGSYRMIRVSLDLGAADRHAELTLALPNPLEPVGKVVTPEVTEDWEDRFKAIIDGSPATLEAVLHRFKLPLHQAETLVVGQVVPLPGCTVSSVKLLARDGRKVATARLGQSGGMRAVRIEAAPHLRMDDMAHLAAASAIGEIPDIIGDLGSLMDVGDQVDMAMPEPITSEGDMSLIATTQSSRDDADIGASTEG